MRDPRLLAAAVGAAALLTLSACTAPAAPPAPPAPPTVADSADLPIAAEGDAPPRLNLGGPPSLEEVEEFLVAVIEDADVVWTEWFLASGLQEPVLEYVVVQPDDAPWVSECRPIVMESDTANAYFCALDGSPDENGDPVGAIMFGAETMQGLWTGNAFGIPIDVSGDFGAALVVAHEFGHHITWELGTQLEWAEPGHVMWFELMADCFAGNWTATAYAKGALETGDLEEAGAVLAVIGDAPGTVDHGSAEQRLEAFLLGYEGDGDEWGPGNPNACISTYWRTDDPTGADG
jgi:Predicted metalloprotease